MWQSFLVTFWRNIIQSLTFSVINILGLAIGLACCILMFLFIHYETTYDTHYNQSNRVYQIWATTKEGTQSARGGISKDILDTLRSYKEYGIKDTTGYDCSTKNIAKFSVRTDIFSENFCHIEDNFFKLLGVSFIQGNPETALSTPYSIIITESLAKKYFGQSNAYNQEIFSKQGKALKVSGIIPDFPPNSHITNKLFVDTKSNSHLMNLDGFPDDQTFFTNGLVLTSDSEKTESLKRGLASAIESASEPWQKMQRRLNFDLELRSLPDIHLQEKAIEILTSDDGSPWVLTNQRMVEIATILLFLVMIVAALNFINMNTARAYQRQHEAAIRKSLGASRKQLFAQHITESIVLSFIALLLALGLTDLVLPGFNTLVDRALSINLINTPRVFLETIILSITTGLVAGIYPALILSRSAKNITDNTSKNRSTLRKSLVISQFSIACLLIVIALTAYHQVKLFKQRDLGYNQDLFIISLDLKSLTRYNTNQVKKSESPNIKNILQDNWTPLSKVFKDELIKNPAIRNASISNYTPGIQLGSGISEAKATDSKNHEFTEIGFKASIDEKFIETYQIPIHFGRNFSEKNTHDFTFVTSQILEGPPPSIKTKINGGSIIITNTAAKHLGYKNPKDAIGKKIEIRPTNNFQKNNTRAPIYTVIGISGNVLFGNNTIGIPVGIFEMNQKMGYLISVTTNTENHTEAIQQIKKTAVNILPEEISIDIHYLPNILEQKLRPFNRLMTTFISFAALTIIISCLGLYAISDFVVDRRTKEIGIRKVLGANTGQLLALLGWDFTKPILTAMAVALPIGYITCEYLLQFLNYRVHVGTMVLGLTALITLLITLLTVGGKTLRVARTHPSESLRYE